MSGPLPESRLDASRVDVWIFDLDNTLYPAESDLFAQVDRRMGEFICALVGCDRVAARRIQKQYYRDYGTTLRGLMSEHGVDPEEFLDYVHRIDVSGLGRDQRLGEAIHALPGRKFIYTNGSRRHAENVAGQIGLLHLFEDIFDIKASAYMPKPNRESYERFVSLFGLTPARAAMFEDLPRNLEAPAALGMTTVLVKPADGAHPDAGERWALPDDVGAHVHHVTTDLTAFLKDLQPVERE